MKLPTMFHRMLRGVCILLVSLGLITVPVIAQDAVELQFRLRQGDVLYFVTTMSVQASVRFPGVPASTTTVQGEGRLAMRTLDVDQEGVMLVESVIEDLKLSTGGQTEESVDEPAVFRIGRDGKIVEWKVRPAALEAFTGLEDFPTNLPGYPVKIGDAWTVPFTLRTQGVKVQGTETFTLAGIESGSQGRVARVRAEGKGTAELDEAPRMPPGFQVQMRGGLRSTGEFEWFVDRGSLAQSHSDGTIEIRMSITTQGQTAEGAIEVQLAMRMSGIAPESVVLPSIPPDQQIIPGKAIGDLSLDLPVTELAAKLGGAGETVSSDAFKVPRTVWERLVAAYIDPADQDKLIGLDIGDKHYRTDKGIGFGSSRGAVLFAYGMSPVILDLTVSVGGIEVLIYNDLGIAFVLTSDARHASASGTHAPIGAVDWITIFRPGDAAKIFNLP